MEQPDINKIKEEPRQGYTGAQLKNFLGNYGLPKNGNKKALAKRLKDFIVKGISSEKTTAPEVLSPKIAKSVNITETIPKEERIEESINDSKKALIKYLRDNLNIDLDEFLSEKFNQYIFHKEIRGRGVADEELLNLVMENNIDIAQFTNTSGNLITRMINLKTDNELIKKVIDYSLSDVKFGLYKPIEMAIDKGNYEILDKLASHPDIIYESLRHKKYLYDNQTLLVSSMMKNISEDKILKIVNSFSKMKNFDINFLMPDVNYHYYDYADMTLLSIATSLHTYRIVNLLLNKGADPNIKNSDGKTSLDIAIATRNRQIANLLLNHGANFKISEIYDKYKDLSDPDHENKRNMILDINYPENNGWDNMIRDVTEPFVSSEDIIEQREYIDDMILQFLLYKNYLEVTIDESELITNFKESGEGCFSQFLEKYENFEDLIPMLNYKNLNDLLTSGFYDSKVMKFVRCLIVSLFNEKTSENLRNFFSINKKPLDVVESIVTQSSFFDLQNNNSGKPFIIKSTIDVNRQDLIHEAFIGLYGTNKLRSKIPNFAYVYGYTSCSLPYYDCRKKEIKTWCTKTNFNNSVDDVGIGKADYLIIENIQNSISLYEALKSLNNEQLLSVYLQVIYSLKLANQEFDYTHYDLHGDNVLIRKLPNHEKFYIPYGDIETGKIVYIKCEFIATIIDYGASVMSYDQKMFGINYLPESGKMATIPSLYEDVHVLFFAMLSEIKSSSINIDILNRILPFFIGIGTNKEEYLSKMQKYRYGAAFNPKTYNFKFGDLIDYISKNIPEYHRVVFETKPNDYPILKCGNDFQCFPSKNTNYFNDIILRIGESDPTNITMIVNVIKNHNNYPDYQDIVSKFRPFIAKIVNDKLSDFRTKLGENTDYYNKNTIELYDIWMNFQDFIKNLKYISTVYPEIATNDIKDNINKEIQVYNDKFHLPLNGNIKKIYSKHHCDSSLSSYGFGIPKFSIDEKVEKLLFL